MKNNDTSKFIELKGSSVTQRTKWDRKTGNKLRKKVFVSRLFFIDETGAKKEVTKEFARRKDASDHIRTETLKFERSGGREVQAAKMTFNNLASHYVDKYATEPRYVDGRKISGLRSVAPVRGYIETLCKRFGNRTLQSLRYSDIRDFKIERLNAPVIRQIKVKIRLSEKEKKASSTRKRFRIEYQETSSQRQIASVNRELMTLRRMLNIAVIEGWILKNPINTGQPLINLADEKMRTRILTRDEEEKLLSVCECDERRHLRSLIICLLDTGLRLNEALTLTWQNVDIEQGIINILAFNSKTASPRAVPISARFETELERLRTEGLFLKAKTEDLENTRVFRIANNVKRSWQTARRLAGLEDIRIHDLRHTFGTRLDRTGFTQAQIARSLGHKQVHTTFRYTNPDQDLLHDIRSALNSINTAKSQ
jgi:integrase